MVDKVHEKVAEEVYKQLEMTHESMIIIHNIPTSQNSRDKKFLSMLESGNDEERCIASKITNLWKSEGLWLSCNKGHEMKRESDQSIRRKHENSVHEELIETVRLIQKSTSPLVRELFKDPDSKTVETSENNDRNLWSIYLNQLKVISHSRVSTSVKTDEVEKSETYRLLEKCKILSDEKATLENSFREKESSYKQDLSRMQKVHSELKDEYEEILKEEQLVRKELEDSFIETIAREEGNHNQIVDSLKSELMDLSQAFHDMLESNKKENDMLVSKTNDLESKKCSLLKEYKYNNDKKMEEYNIMTENFEKEKIERFVLEDRIALLDLNLSIVSDEEKILQNVQMLEDKADEILAKGAIQIQRLYRGKRDRGLASKLKKSTKKSGRNKKKGGKSKKKGKGSKL